MIKFWSPMSVGSWALLIFGIFSLVSFLGALAEDDRLDWPAWRKVASAGNAERRDCRARRACWVFRRRLHRSPSRCNQSPDLVGHASARHAFSGFRRVHIRGIDDPPCAQIEMDDARLLHALHRMDAWVVALEFIVLIAVMISLGPVFRAWLSAWGLLLFFGVIVVGMLIPLALHWRRQWLGDHNANHGSRTGIGRRVYSSPGHRLFGPRSVM